MKNALAFFNILFLALSASLSAQSLFDEIPGSGDKDYKLGGFIRSGFYINSPDGSSGIPVTFADFRLEAEAGNGTDYKAFADLRYRYGSEYGSTVNKASLREAWAAWYTPYTEIRAGKQIIKWSRMDFFRLQDAVNPRNDLFRSFDPADRDLGNISLNLNINPSENISLQAVFIPRYRASELYTGFMDLPAIINIKDFDAASYKSASYGLRAELFLRNFNADIGFYDGYNPLPGLGLDTIITGGQDNAPSVVLEENPFKIRTLSAGMELILGKNILRTEFAWTDPDADHRQKENVMLPEIRWAAGLERSFGDLQVLLEYSGKYLCDFFEAAFDPVLPDESSFNELGQLPPEQAFNLARLQIGSFNRLYNYQMDEYSHYAGLSLSSTRALALIKPSVNILYNINAGEYLLNPVLEINPSDNLEIIAGAEIYGGRDNSLFDMISESLNSFYTGLRIDF
ncbi:MAG: hypothetical protein V2I34_01145 [Bacteroidales bacterium]|jgi:hypothetical protein|nr:hypothetical protein [Bacteroidales bacterium]